MKMTVPLFVFIISGNIQQNIINQRLQAEITARRRNIRRIYFLTGHPEKILPDVRCGWHHHDTENF